jgi:ABC-type cobalamin transport system ATPase subunit
MVVITLALQVSIVKALQTSDVAGSTLDQSNTIYSGTDWQEIRFAEVMLNYAESACRCWQIR